MMMATARDAFAVAQRNGRPCRTARDRKNAALAIEDGAALDAVGP